MKTIGYAAADAKAKLAPFHFERRNLRPDDVGIDILYCGVCHSDLHTARNDWKATVYPTVPGHEIVGRVREVGDNVTQYKVGERVAVGCFVDSCQTCDQCHQGLEQYCQYGRVDTYNSRDPQSRTMTFGGYSKYIVVREKFVLRVPENLDLAKTAPLLCAGITTYSPLRTWQVGPGSRIAVVGLGGLGHMAVKLACAMGAHVTVLSRTPDKQPDAIALGADAFLLSSGPKAMRDSANSFSVIIDTIPVKHDINAYLPLLNIDGTLVVVGQVGALAEANTLPLIFGRRRIAGSLVGGIKETQDMLDFCARKQILPDCEMIDISNINEAYERMLCSDVRYRFVIDMASL